MMVKYNNENSVKDDLNVTIQRWSKHVSTLFPMHCSVEEHVLYFEIQKYINVSSLMLQFPVVTQKDTGNQATPLRTGLKSALKKNPSAARHILAEKVR